ncbi:acylglycerol kinase family protein [Patescibacteria group bacterium]|nr:acylglycerol kinase family protein [Patescibacteria group bacterium]MBU4482132.1 acylglycerol kinase family protein [Patescibacteria group bacterium]
MYYYIYDQFLSHKKYDKILTQIESKITDLGIKNRIIKMSILKSVSELVTDALRKGAQTIVVAGNNQTVHQIVNLVAGKDVTLGIIPIGETNSIANFLGITDPLEACEIISARKIETINLGEVNNDFFIDNIKIFDTDLRVECDNKYNISTLSVNHLIGVYNFAPQVNLNFKSSKQLFNPQDTFLEVVVEPKDKKTLNKIFKPLFGSQSQKFADSVFRARKIIIKNQTEKPGYALVDNFKTLKTPLAICISNKQLRVIVGKNRKF